MSKWVLASKGLNIKCWGGDSRYRSRHLEKKCTLSFLLQATNSGEEGLQWLQFVKSYLSFREIFLFIREMNEPVMAIRGKPFHNLYQFFLQSFVYIC